jgi:hypothetical protein
LLRILIGVPIPELVSMRGLPAAMAPFFLATGLVSAVGWLDG